jgi:TorA maturation chaperone TorD
MYKFLAAAYLEPPSQPLLAPLLADGFVEWLEEVFGAPAAQDLQEFVQGVQGDYEKLDQEFQSLFIVPLGRYVTPYEAVYRDEREMGDTRVRGLLMGPSTLAVKQLYREAGAAVSEDFKDLPDHIGLELACMEFLCRGEAQAWDQENLDEVRRLRDFQRRLLQEHLLQWVPTLCRRIRESATGPLYRGIASLTEAYLADEAETLAAPVGASG